MNSESKGESNDQHFEETLKLQNAKSKSVTEPPRSKERRSKRERQKKSQASLSSSMKNENLNIPEGEKFVKISDLINHRLNMLNDSNYMDSDSPIKYNNTEDN